MPPRKREASSQHHVSRKSARTSTAPSRPSFASNEPVTYIELPTPSAKLEATQRIPYDLPLGSRSANKAIKRYNSRVSFIPRDQVKTKYVQETHQKATAARDRILRAYDQIRNDFKAVEAYAVQMRLPVLASTRWYRVGSLIALNADQLEANFRLQPVTHAGDFVDLLLQMFREKNWFKLDRIQILRKALSDSPDP